ncbi:MAG: hypothetical protein HC778_02260 [Chamaesiphon sp. CSU_1_12]|nr:hypothetical protein [Chamaesiphon sp. CSU_1_12]
MSTKQVRQILVIIALILFISPLILIVFYPSSGDSDNPSEQVAIVTSEGEIPMMYLSSTLGGQTEVAKKINAFTIDPSQSSLQLTQDDRPLVLIFSIIVPIVTISMLYLMFARP